MRGGEVVREQCVYKQSNESRKKGERHALDTEDEHILVIGWKIII